MIHNGKMDVSRERINRFLELREMLLSFQTGFNLVSAAVVCAIHFSRHNESGKKTRQTEEKAGRQHRGMDRPGVR